MVAAFGQLEKTQLEFSIRLNNVSMATSQS
jgi:hypothetical protein